MSMITTTYPLTGMNAALPSTTVAARPRPWGFWATLGWFGVAVVAFFATATTVGFGYGIWWVIAHPGVPVDVNASMLEYLVTAIAIAIAMPAAALVLAFGAHRTGWSTADYLGLRLPRLRDVAIGLGSLLAFGVLVTIVASYFPAIDQSEVVTSEYRTAMSSFVTLAMFWVTLVVTAPIAEELIFRGFLFRGWSASRLGAIGAVMLTALIFGAIHLQYTVPGMLVVFGLGLLFGVMRWRSGSTLLVILMHGVWNFTVGTAVMLSA